MSKTNETRSRETATLKSYAPFTRFVQNSDLKVPVNRRRSQSRAVKARVMEGVVIDGCDILIGAPVFFPHSAPGRIINCRIGFIGEQPRIGLFYTRRGVWLGKYDIEHRGQS